MVLSESKPKFLEQLSEEINQHLDADQAEAVINFAEQYYENFPLLDLSGWKIKDIYGCIFGSWKFIQKFDLDHARVRVFNPEFEVHGWQSPHTVVAIHTRNLPFILDSTRLELNRRNVIIHKVHRAVLAVRRDANQQLLELLPDPRHTLEPDISQEALFYLELAHCSDSGVRGELSRTLQEVIDEVQIVVDDFIKMRNKALEVIAKLPSETVHLGADAIKEAKELLRWLHDDHFTFIGFEELQVNYEKEIVKVEKCPANSLGLLKYLPSLSDTDLLQEINSSTHDELATRLLAFGRSSRRCRVHRNVYPDYVSIRDYDDEGRVCHEYRFMGLYTSVAYTQSAMQIPILRKKVQAVIQHSGFHPDSHDGKQLLRVMEVFPRDELFLADLDELCAMVMGVYHIQERRQVRLFLRRERAGKFFSALVYTPKDVYCTELRENIQQILCDALGADESEFTTYFSESVLTRTYFELKVETNTAVDYDVALLEKEIVEASKRWEDQLREALMEEFGEEQGNREFRLYENAFPPGYQHDFDPRAAINDIKKIATLDDGRPLATSFYRVMEEAKRMLRFRLFYPDEPMVLSDVIPILENLGLIVVGEAPYDICRSDGKVVWIHDFSVQYNQVDAVDLGEVREKFQDAFTRICAGDAESDAFNKLILGTHLNWREIALLRAYARYMKQIKFSFDTVYIAEALCRHMHITQWIVDLFDARFNPRAFSCQEDRVSQKAKLEEHIIDALEGVENLNEDRLIRHYVELIQATLRTNFYQLDELGEGKKYFSFKLSPKQILDIPRPRPLYEIFVYSPRMEGIHLRGGKVARGGLRWSDRKEDFRTEVLGLVKAQQVKNAVIVPVGAKGGFVVKRPPPEGDREALLAEGIECYKILIRGILDITDNLVEGQVEPPENVVRKDDDDTYLVVAADKGTATFSDIANEISKEYGFWLGDAFASGGSIGYDHKKMGITARGAWVSVQRLFKERGLNTQKEDFTVLGIGDMAGDVFGNGMLMSKHIRLQAAFNHLHIFIDPNPDASKSFRERKRLFEAARSGWGDYDTKLISKGGGVFRRSAKSIKITPEMKSSFGITEKQLTPNKFISRLLCSPVDLVWNGGIGTYVKASSENDADVGDKANDPLRVNAVDLQCKVIGEGGNLGLTQLARVEYNLHGGASNTDFIDNAGGVDCSDHEVNIKILLNEVVASDDMTEKQRRLLLEEMTNSISKLVLLNNYRQTQAISIAERQAFFRLGEYKRLIHSLENSGKLDRGLEYIPDDEELLERKVNNVGLARAELSVLISYVKGILKEELANSDIPDDTFFSKAIETAFPAKLVKKFRQQIQSHRLRREIVATQIANDMVNHMGITFVDRLQQSTGENSVDVARAYVTTREIFSLADYWRQIEALDYVVTAELQMSMMADLMQLVRRSSRWFLRNKRSRIDPAAEISRFKRVVQEIATNIDQLFEGHMHTGWQMKKQHLVDEGVPEKLASYIAGGQSLYAAMGIAEAARQAGSSPLEVAKIYFVIGEELGLNWFGQQIADLKVDNHWQALARETFRDDLEWQQRSLTVAVLRYKDDTNCVSDCMTQWLKNQAVMVERWRAVLTELQATDVHEFAMYSVAIRELLDLAQSSEHK